MMSSVERTFQIIDLQHEKPGILPSDENLVDKWPKAGDLEFNNVSFRYNETNEMVLKGLSFKIKHGEKIGVIGRTGAGKSSILQAMFRMTEI